MSPGPIRRVSAEELRSRGPEFVEILADAVAGGASVGFMDPLTPGEGQDFWDAIAEGVEAGDILLWGVELDGRMVGTVQLHPSPKANQRHRADVSKLLVHRSARRHGLGRALMTALEAEAERLDRWLLVLDTCVGGGAERLYESMGWVAIGAVPDYALFPDGRFCDAAFYWKRLASAPPERPSGSREA